LLIIAKRSEHNKMKRAHIIIITAIMASVIGTFFVTNVTTGLGAITGNAVASGSIQLESAQAAVGAFLFALVSLAALVVVARVGANSIQELSQDSGTPTMNAIIEKAESAIQRENYPAAYSHYNSIRQQYAGLETIEKLQYYARIIEVHRQLAKQATIAEANRLTDKYVNGAITEQEFEKLKQLLTSQ